MKKGRCVLSAPCFNNLPFKDVTTSLFFPDPRPCVYVSRIAGFEADYVFFFKNHFMDNFIIRQFVYNICPPEA